MRLLVSLMTSFAISCRTVLHLMTAIAEATVAGPMGARVVSFPLGATPDSLCTVLGPVQSIGGETMNDSKFDSLARFLGSRPSRRQVLKGLVAGSALTAATVTLPFGEAAAQCLEDGEVCSAGNQCCSGNCDASTGYCFSLNDTCLNVGEPCFEDADCCSTYCNPDSGMCGVPMTCLNDGEPCFENADCCSEICDATSGTCVASGECRADGEACEAGRDCCSGNCDATTGYCGVAAQPAGTGGTTSLPASGSGSSLSQDSSLVVPLAAVGAAAAVLGARRMRGAAQDETQA